MLCTYYDKLLKVLIYEKWKNSNGHQIAKFHLLPKYYHGHSDSEKECQGQPQWLSGLAPAFGPGCDPGDPGSSPTSGSNTWSLLLPLPVSLPLSLS